MLQCLAYLGVLNVDKRRIWISIAMIPDENGLRFIMTVFVNEPSRAFRDEW